MKLLSAAALLLFPVPSIAGAADVAACTGIADPSQRLACYDQAAGRTIAAPRDPVAEFGHSSAAGPAISALVRPRAPERPAAPEVEAISSTIVGTGTDSATGRLSVNLANEQTWVVTGWDRPLLPKLNTPVTVSRGWFGDYLITVSSVAYGAARSQ